MKFECPKCGARTTWEFVGYALLWAIVGICMTQCCDNLQVHPVSKLRARAIKAGVGEWRADDAGHAEFYFKGEPKESK